MEDDTITISKEKHRRLLRDSLILAYLEVAGVDNWEGYEEAQRMMREHE